MAQTKKASKKMTKKPFSVIKNFLKKRWQSVKNFFARQRKRHQDFMSRRPHRSFYLTKKRDAKRSWKMPGYFAFTHQVWKTIWDNKRIFLKFILLYSVLSLLIVGTLSQDNYIALRDQVNEASENFGIGEVVSLFAGAVTSGSGEEATMTSQTIAGLLLLFGWLVVVWILRRRLVGDKIKLRDALYSAGSPLMATFILLIIMALQLLPLALVMIAYSAFTGVGFINWDISIENMAAWCAVAVAVALTIYWMTTSFIALIIVTNPGIYPFQAMRIAGDIAVGRRSRIMLRLIFMCLPLIVMWLVILIPVILIDQAIQIDWLPLVPLFVLILSSLTLLWCASYIYLLYRRLIDDNSAPAKR